ncbi:hypothetical protein NL676_008784 [Syzygium grande]|nr:hypothetical protein NL676_008784 [Syzygium grande]
MISIMWLTYACLQADPRLQLTMRQVSQELHVQVPLEMPFSAVSLEQLRDLNGRKFRASEGDCKFGSQLFMCIVSVWSGESWSSSGNRTRFSQVKLQSNPDSAFNVCPATSAVIDCNYERDFLGDSTASSSWLCLASSHGDSSTQSRVVSRDPVEPHRRHIVQSIGMPSPSRIETLPTAKRSPTARCSSLS